MKLPFSVAVLITVLMSAGVAAQWGSAKHPNLPRLPDGSVNLKAPAPRQASGQIDLSGIWRLRAGFGTLQEDIAGNIEPPMQPWAATLYGERRASQGLQHPRVRCLPRGIPNAMLWRPGPFKFIHTPGNTLILYEEFVTYRQVFTDGRPLPSDAQPAWWGYSVGRWASDSFVVETSGFKDNGWLDFRGHPATDAMRVTETFRRPTLIGLELEVTFNDPKAYTKPWSVKAAFDLMPDDEFIEHVCENEVTYERLSGNSK